LKVFECPIEGPLVIEDADAFIPINYRDGFTLTESKKIDQDLTVSIHLRKHTS